MASHSSKVNNMIINAIILVFIITSFVPGAESDFISNQLRTIFPRIEVTLSNDENHTVWFMCQMTDTSNSLQALQAQETYRFEFTQIAFPMRWCFLYINKNSHGFFWAYTVRARCTKCFWSINKHPLLYRGDRSRWERQKLFMPQDFDINEYIFYNSSDS